MDKSRRNLSAEECFYLLNNERYLNLDGSKRGTLGPTGPMVANKVACEIEFPLGENYIIGKYYCNLTNQLYYFNWNSNGVHFISRISGDGICEIVYTGECLTLSADPRHSIEQFRAYVQLDKFCANRHGISLIWVNGDGAIGQIDTEASIATDFFTTPFFEKCAEGCEVIQMCVPDPCGCLVGEFVPLDENDKGKKNNLIDVGIKLSYRHIYYDGRASIWADPSTLFYQDTKGCFENEDGFPRCLKIRVPVGNPLVDKIEIAYSKDGIWYSAEVVDKYKKYNSSQQYWYERELAELTNYSDDDCSFDYLFCNDKQCEAIEPKEFSRVFNPMPINPQGILPIGIGEDRTALGFYNYEQGSCPIDKIETQKFDIGIDCPVDNCNPEYCTIKIRAIVHNFEHNYNQPIFRLKGGSISSNDDTSDTAYFGGLNKVGSGDLELGYGQQFKDKVRNFIVYVEGTDSWAEMKQWKSSAYFSQQELVNVLGSLDEGSTKRQLRREIKNGNFFYQEAEIKVIKGTRGFLRLSSHESTGNDQDTSTFVRGVLNTLTQYKGNLSINSITDLSSKEIYFDTCGKNELDILQAFVISDNAVDAGLSTAASAHNGYLEDNNGRPVEGAVIAKSFLGVSLNLAVTDHNGFWHYYGYPGTDDDVTVQVKVEQDCFNFTSVKEETIGSEIHANTRHDIKIDDEPYSNGFYANVKMLVQDCDGTPVGGVRVALSGTKYDVTGADGYARFKVRNYSTRDRVLRIIVLNNNGCFSVDCNGVCNPCMPTNTSNTIPCYYAIPEVIFSTSVINRSFSLTNTKGLKGGGRYPFGFYVRFDCGLISPVYEIKYLDIPKTQDKGKEGFCSFTYNGGGIVLPPGAKCLNVVRGENVNPFELQWVIDKIERVDGKIKLTIQSLNDYNEKYFFKTNTLYQWLKGDRIEFIKNGDGVIYDTATYGILNYLTISPFHDELESGREDADADYFNQLLIDDDSKLDGLKEGAVIEIQRSKECSTIPVYFSICASIPVNEDGTLAYETGVFTTFDTYFVKRNIGKLPSQQFEHHSPSDFWGERLTDAGRAYFVNKYENKRRYGRNITINAPTQFNYFGDLVRTIQPDGHGDIVAMWLTDNKIGLCISEHDNSLFEVGDDLLRVDGNGIVRAVGADALISDPQPKLTGRYGCQYSGVGSIYFGDGWATWVDTNRHTYVKHDYNSAKAMDEFIAQSYFRKRCQELESFNKVNSNPLDQFRYITGMNQHTGALHLTIKSLRHGGIYNEIKPFEKDNDTIMFEPLSGDCLGFASFTPEAYGQLNLFDGNGAAFISFLNGVPFIHPILTDRWNEFYSVACDRVIGMSMNSMPKKIKEGLAIEVQDETMWFVADVSIEKSNFRSEIPAVRWKKDKNKWNAAFLRDINSRGGLYNGNIASDYYHAVTFVRDNTIDLKYGTIDDNKRTKFDSLNMILFKFKYQEQSGFEENL